MKDTSTDKRWKADELAGILDGTWVTAPPPEWFADSFTINEKYIPQNAVFIALSEDTKTDEDENPRLSEKIRSIEKNICGVITRKRVFFISPDLPQLIVEDSSAVIEKLALNARNSTNSKVICITGAKHRNYVRQLTDFLLQVNNTTYTNGPADNKSIDNLLSLASSKHGPDYIILETFYYDIRKGNGRLCHQLAPHICVITDAGITDREVKNPEKSLQHKLNFCQHINNEGIVIISGEMKYYELVRNELSRMGVKTISYGFTEACDVRAVSYEVSESGYLINAVARGKEIEYYLPVYGKAMLESSLAALAIMDTAGVKMEQTEHLASFIMPEGDRNFDALPFKKGSVYFIDDSRYNTLSSLIFALDTFKDLEINEGGKKIAVLGEILFSGRQTNEQFIEALDSFEFDTVLFYGKEMAEIYRLMPDDFEKMIYYKEVNVIDDILDNLWENDLVYLKGGNLDKTPQRLHKRIIRSNRFKYNWVIAIAILVGLFVIRLI